MGSPFVGGTGRELTFQRVGPDGVVAPPAVARMTFGGGALLRPKTTTTPDALTGFGLVPSAVVQRPDRSLLVIGEVGVGYIDDAEVDVVGRGTGITAIGPGLTIDRGFGGAAARPAIYLRVPTQQPGMSVRVRVTAPPGAATFTVRAAGRTVASATHALRDGRQLVRIALTPAAARTLRRAAPGRLRVSRALPGPARDPQRHDCSRSAAPADERPDRILTAAKDRRIATESTCDMARTCDHDTIQRRQTAPASRTPK
jgi:hypothetical protein